MPLNGFSTTVNRAGCPSGKVRKAGQPPSSAPLIGLAGFSNRLRKGAEGTLRPADLQENEE